MLRSRAKSAKIDALESRQHLNAGYVLDFEHDADGLALSAGAVITDQWYSWGVRITTDAAEQDHPAMIFDSAHPSGDDADLGTPNRGFKIDARTQGPGEGHGGAPTSPASLNPYANSTALRNVLIVAQSADADSTNGANDWDGGGELIFDFDDEVTIQSLDVLDIDTSEGTPLPGTASPTPADVSVVEVFDADGALLASFPLAGAGDNSFQSVTVGVSGIRRLAVSFRGQPHGSGAIDNVRFSVDPAPVEPPPVVRRNAALGDRVWYDRDGDGKQDSGEEGLAGVKVKLFKAGIDGVAGTTDDIFTGKVTRTGASGQFGFTGLAAGSYFAKFTLPAGFNFTNLGSAAHSQVVRLKAGQTNRTADAGLIKGLSLFRFSRYKPTDSFEKTFGVDVPGVGEKFTLLQALNTAGNSSRSLNRQAVLALLKASKPGNHYRYSPAQLTALVRHSYQVGAHDAVKKLFEAENQ